MPRKIEDEFTEAMFTIYRRAKLEAKYNATIFFQMICDQGGLATAKTLINSFKPSDGYTALHLRERLNPSMLPSYASPSNSNNYSQ